VKPKEIGALVLLAALWGGSFIFFRIAAPELGPILVAFLRVVIAGSALLVYAAVARRDADWRGSFRKYLVLGTLNGALPYALIAAAELHLTASFAAILNATTPLYAVVVAAVRFGERPVARTALGVVLGVAGVAVLVGWESETLDARLLTAVGASLVAALSYALAGAYAKTAFTGAPPLTLAIGQQIGAAVVLAPLLVPVSVVDGGELAVTRGAVAAVVALALFCTSVAYLLYFFLIDRVGPTRTLSVTFLSPVFGVLWGAMFLDEAIGAGTVVGLGVILVGVTLVTGVRLRSVLFAVSRTANRMEPPRLHSE
jgi:drug/metabolite transporter (DMT)-like permease